MLKLRFLRRAARPRYLTLLAGVPLLAGCGAANVAGGGAEQPLNHRVIAVVGDGSCDATAAGREETLKVAGLAAAAAASQRGTLLVDRIGRNALASMRFDVQQTFTVSSDVPSGNSTLAKEYLDGLAKRVVGRAQNLPSAPTQRCGTDLAGGFLAIARALQSYSAEPRTAIVV